MKIVGLKIEKGLVAASIVQKGFRQNELTGSFSQPFATDAELVEILKDKAREWAGAKIVSSIPGQLFSQRPASFPFADRKRVEKALPFEIEDGLPFPLDDIVIDHLVLDGGQSAKGAGASKEAAVLALMLPKTVLKQHLDLLASAGIDPQFIVPSYVGLYSLSEMMKSEGCTLLACGRDLCLRSNGAVKALRSFSGLGPTAGLRHTVQSLETEQKERVEKASLLCADDGTQGELTALGIAVEQITPELGGKKAVDPVSLGLALSEQVNFRKGEFSYRLADEGAHRRKRTLIVAGAAAAVLFAVNLGVRYYLIRGSYSKLDQEIRAIYHQAVPDAKMTADPDADFARILKSSLDEARKKFGVLGTGASALDVMKAVTDGTPKEVRVSFQEFNLEADRLKLQGEAASFESVDKIKAELLKSELFSEVTVMDTRMGADNKVKFRLDIKLKPAA